MTQAATSGAGSFSVEEAVQEIGRVEALSDALEARTSALTWMVWGLTMAGIFVSYSYVGVVLDAYSSDVDVLFPVLWIPWVAMAAVITRVLWSSAGLVMPADRQAGDREGIISGVVFLGLIFGGLYLASRMDVAILEPAVVMLAVGVATGALAILGVNASGRIERRAGVVAGAGIAGVALIATPIVGTGGTGYAWLSLIAPAISALAYFAVAALILRRG